MSESRTTKFNSVRVLSAVKKVYASYIIATTCDFPVLRQDQRKNWQIVWEDGPVEWAVYFADACPLGSDSPDKATPVRDAFSGVAQYPAPTGIPSGLLLEPQSDHVLGVYMV